MKRNNTMFAILGLLIVGLLILGATTLVLAHGSNPNNDVNTGSPTGPASSPMMGQPGPNRAAGGNIMGQQGPYNGGRGSMMEDDDMMTPQGPYNGSTMDEDEMMNRQGPNYGNRGYMYGTPGTGNGPWGQDFRGYMQNGPRNGMHRGAFMNGGQGNMMSMGWFGGARMGNFGWTSNSTPISADKAHQIAEEYVDRYNAFSKANLEVAEVMEFNNQFYVQAREKDTGRYAFEFLIDRFTGVVHPEPGPNMIWNTKYGMMRGGLMGGNMMGGTWSTPTESMTITPKRAIAIAQQYLDTYGGDRQAADEADAFYGYYTIHILKDGKVVGMLSVNGYTGSVWEHTWHGQFLGMVEGDTH